MAKSTSTRPSKSKDAPRGKTPRQEPSAAQRAAHEATRRAVLEKTHGTAEEQKKALVEEILNAFHRPEKWPWLDGDRVLFLRLLYRRAVDYQNLVREKATEDDLFKRILEAFQEPGQWPLEPAERSALIKDLYEMARRQDAPEPR